MKLAILSDIHEDIKSLQNALKKIEKMNCDKIICLGDISGFGVPHNSHFATRNAHQCLQLVKEHCDIIIIGNHDLNACKRIPEINPEFEYPANWFELDYYEKQEISQYGAWLYDNDELNPLYKKEDLEFLRSLPEYYILKLETYNMLLSHFVYPNLTGSMKTFIRDKSDFIEHFEFMKEHQCKISFCGHVHIPESLIVYKNEIRQKRFKKTNIRSENVCIVAPSIVNSKCKGRFLILDTENLKLENIKI